MAAQVTISPNDLQPVVQRIYPSSEELDAAITRAATAQKSWSAVPLQERIAIGHKFIEEFTGMGERVPAEIAKFMGRLVCCCSFLRLASLAPSPISQGAAEVRGFLDRAAYMLSIAAASLADVTLENTDKPGFRRFIKRIPLGVVLVIAPWKSVPSVSVHLCGPK